MKKEEVDKMTLQEAADYAVSKIVEVGDEPWDESLILRPDGE